MWNLWKKRDRRVFEGKDVNVTQLKELIEENVELLCFASNR